jgi:hypothetical protein
MSMGLQPYGPKYTCKVAISTEGDSQDLLQMDLVFL